MKKNIVAHVTQNGSFKMRVIAIISFIFYCIWNLKWLIIDKRIPPSIFKESLGLPVPTTGMYRSFKFLLEGNITKSLLYNAFTIPFIIILFITLFSILSNYFKNKNIELSKYLSQSWFVVISSAWILKFIIGSNYW